MARVQCVAVRPLLKGGRTVEPGTTLELSLEKYHALSASGHVETLEAYETRREVDAEVERFRGDAESAAKEASARALAAAEAQAEADPTPDKPRKRTRSER